MSTSPDPWTKCNIAAVLEGGDRPIRVATDGNRVRIRCTDARFDPPIDLSVSDFQKILAAAALIGLGPRGDAVLERKDMDAALRVRNGKLEDE